MNLELQNRCKKDHHTPTEPQMIWYQGFKDPQNRNVKNMIKHSRDVSVASLLRKERDLCASIGSITQ